MKIVVTHKLAFDSTAEAYDYIKRTVLDEHDPNYYELLSHYIVALVNIESGIIGKYEDSFDGVTIAEGDET